MNWIALSAGFEKVRFMPATVAPFAYDTIAYPSLTHPQSHPQGLAPKATLLGLSPAPPDRCRVLELGCGDGFNLASMAAAYPRSSYVGVDLSSQAIERGRRMLAATGLSAVELRQASITDVDRSWGEFDYIIAHGVYSWVPPEVREAVLRVAGSLLAPHGLAFVSYLALPGAHIREMVRSLTRFHTSAMSDPDMKAREAISLIGFLGRASTENSTYHRLMQTEFESLRNRGTDTLFHDELGDVSAPLYFRDFCLEAGRHGLQFLSDAEYVEPPSYGLTDEAREMLAPLTGNRLLLEQYLDFVHGRRFRQTLLCRSTLDVALQRVRLQHLYIACDARPVDPPDDLTTDDFLTFQGMKQAAFRCEHPLTKAVLCELARIYPERMPYSEALRAGIARLGKKVPIAAADEERLRHFLTRLYAPSLVELHTLPLPFSVSPGERPTASSLALWLLQQELDHVASLHGKFVTIQGHLGRFLLGLLNGQRDRGELLEEVRKFLRNAADLPDTAEESHDKLPDWDAPDLAEQLERALTGLARLGVLNPAAPE
jgi:SAM-dependent methyltransferase